jgi:lysophospholipase L1-like esterase
MTASTGDSNTPQIEPPLEVRPVRKLVFGLLAVVVSLAASELALRAAAEIFPFVRYHLAPPWSRNQIADAALGYRLSPYFPGHDHRGYRNDEELLRYEIVAAGDSFTYGFGVASQEAWPRQLQHGLGMSVYNAGVGGYGPCEYALVMSELLVLRPAQVVLGVYVGNDMANAFASVYVDGRCPDLRTTDDSTLEAIRAADDRGTLPQLAVKYLKPSVDAPAPSVVGRLALYGLGRSAWSTIGPRAWNSLGQRNAEFDPGCLRASTLTCLVLDTPAHSRTVFRDPESEALAVNLDDPRINEGLRITHRAIERIAAQLRAHHIELLVAVFHNKPFVAAPLIRAQRPDLWPKLKRLVELEDQLTANLVQRLEDQGIRYVDTGPPLQSAVANGQVPYQASDDDHPNALGHSLFAQTIAQRLRR